jgi:hypothetical protein
MRASPPLLARADQSLATAVGRGRSNLSQKIEKPNKFSMLKIVKINGSKYLLMVN